MDSWNLHKIIYVTIKSSNNASILFEWIWIFFAFLFYFWFSAGLYTGPQLSNIVYHLIIQDVITFAYANKIVIFFFCSNQISFVHPIWFKFFFICFLRVIFIYLNFLLWLTRWVFVYDPSVTWITNIQIISGTFEYMHNPQSKNFKFKF